MAVVSWGRSHHSQTAEGQFSDDKYELTHKEKIHDIKS